MARKGNPFAVKGKVDVSGPLRKLSALKRNIRTKAIKKGVTQGSKIVLKAVKAAAPIDTTTAGLTVRGLYKKALGRKVKVFRHSGTVYAIVGARTNFKQQVRTQADGTPVYQDPSKIGHLVEFGHGGPHPAPPHPHLRPAWDQSIGQVQGAIVTECQAALTEAGRA